MQKSALVGPLVKHINFELSTPMVQLVFTPTQKFGDVLFCLKRSFFDFYFQLESVYKTPDKLRITIQKIY
jgi:hypothetical protein